VDYVIAQHAALIATNPSNSTIAAIKKTNTIPVFMMVSPSPKLAGLTDKDGKAPANLYGVYENQDYIDTSVALIHKLMPKAHSIGVIYNQAEAQSVTAIDRVKQTCARLGLELVLQSAGSSNDVQLVTESVLSKHVDAFFAMPDNIVFSAFEVIQKACDRANVPIFTSEAGLVKRGAVCAYGADMYAWGYQSGLQAALFLKNKSLQNIAPEAVKKRIGVANIKAAQKFGIALPVGYVAVE
jgi:putative ABC transport system substrate-binding protein